MLTTTAMSHFHSHGRIRPTLNAAHTMTFCCVPAERHHGAGLQRQRPRRRPSAGRRLRRVRGGSQRRGADERGHLPPVLGHSQQRGKATLFTLSKESGECEKRSGSSVSLHYHSKSVFLALPLELLPSFPGYCRLQLVPSGGGGVWRRLPGLPVQRAVRGRRRLRLPLSGRWRLHRGKNSELALVRLQFQLSPSRLRVSQLV